MLPSVYSDSEELIEDVEVEEEETFIEYAYDFEKNEFIYENGKVKVVEGLEAIKIWIKKALSVSRFKYLVYSDVFGHELDDLTGTILSKEALESEAKRLLEECLFENDFIESVTNVIATFKNSKTIINATINTKFGEVNI